PANLQESLANGTVTKHLASFTPQPGDTVLIPAGTVHSLADVIVFEIQENSDVTFRLYDWNHVDAKTGKPRALQVDAAMACINFSQGELKPVVPVLEEALPVRREQLFACAHFDLWRLSGNEPFMVGLAGTTRVLVCIDGEAELEHAWTDYTLRKGDVMLLPAEVGACVCQPSAAVVLLEISLPEKA
ncbi:MAG: hypothetical protein PSV43_21465, partial [Prosthecobacter sp.]|nr:hypothetical protein [Prosthecobacter sp.]